MVKKIFVVSLLFLFNTTIPTAPSVSQTHANTGSSPILNVNPNPDKPEGQQASRRIIDSYGPAQSSFNTSDKHSWQKMVLMLLMAADLATELHNAVHDTSNINDNSNIISNIISKSNTKFNAFKAGLVTAILAGGREPGWFDVVLYGGAVTAHALYNYANGDPISLVRRMIKNRKEQGEIEELRKKFKEQEQKITPEMKQSDQQKVD